jgi:hypothetical protein
VTVEVSEGSDDWVVEHRYRAVLQVLDGVPKAQVAREFGASRQSVQLLNWHFWCPHQGSNLGPAD